MQVSSVASVGVFFFFLCCWQVLKALRLKLDILHCTDKTRRFCLRPDFLGTGPLLSNKRRDGVRQGSDSFSRRSTRLSSFRFTCRLDAIADSITTQPTARSHQLRLSYHRTRIYIVGRLQSATQRYLIGTRRAMSLYFAGRLSPAQSSNQAASSGNEPRIDRSAKEENF